MRLDFRAALQTLGPDAAFRIANAARTPASYLLNTILPEQARATYHVDSGTMTVRSTMAGLVGMDSPYPPGGIVELSTFLERTAKIANHVKLDEQTLRHIQEWMQRIGAGGGSNEALVQEALNFYQKAILQPHFDTFEWLRGRALAFGVINWTFNGVTLDIDYGVPAANFLATRTLASNEAYEGTASAFWADVRLLRRALKGDVRAILAHPDTVEAAQYNAANSMVTVAEGDGSVTFQRVVNNGAAASLDRGDRVTIIKYGAEGEMLNPADPDSTVVLPFIPRGKLIAVGNNRASGYVVGQGSTQDPNEENRLGYTHIAPTVEGGGQPGRWGELYTPERAPWELHGRAVSNGIPVIEAPTKIAVATTEMS